MRRLFIAIDIPEDVKNRLDLLISGLKSYVSGRFVSREKFHVTILFLGDPPVSDEEIIKIVKEQKLDTDINLSSFGAFPNLKKPRVLFIEVKTDLRFLYAELIEKLKIKLSGEFHPHLTVCRLYEKGLKKGDIAMLPNVNETFRADKLSLFNSDIKNYYRLY
jgi:2'-5' RNA ligase